MARNSMWLQGETCGFIAPGLRANLNAIDPHGLSVGLPQLMSDLPAHGKRFVQRASGYVSTWVAGQQVQRHGEITSARPGQLVRMK